MTKKNLLKKNKVSLSGDDVKEGLTSVLSIKIPDPKFSSQTKDKLVSSEVRNIVETIINEKLSIWFDQNPSISKIILTINIKDISEEIKIGMTADLEFKVEGNEEKILVPTVSIVTEKGEKGILKVDKNNSPKFEKIEIGISSGNKTSVIDGLEPGEQIFIDIPPWAKKRKWV